MLERATAVAKRITSAEQEELHQRTQRLREKRLAMEAAGVRREDRWDGPVRIAARVGEKGQH
ncbi:MAG: hypothetical protein P8Y71_22450 [Pseudolabrys sp.]